MWSDEIFAPTPSQAKLHFLARCCGAVYNGTLTELMPDAVRVYAGPPAVWKGTIEGEKVCIFEGTTNQNQVIGQTAGYFAPLPFSGGGIVNGWVSNVSYNQYPTLPNDVSLLAGHSLGGNLALMAADHLRRDGLHPHGVVTYGSNRIFNDAAAASPVWLPVVNVKNYRDPVPLLVPDGRGGANWRLPGRFFNISLGHHLAEVEQGVSYEHELTYLLGRWGDTFHSSGVYIELLSDPFTKHVKTVEDSAVSRKFYVKIKGKCFGQRVENVLWYLAAGDNIGTFKDDFVSVWQTNVLPRLSDKYNVVRYEFRELGSVAFKDPTTPPFKPSYRWSNVIKVTGLAGDYGTRSGAVMPTQVTLGMEKVCGQWNDSSDNPIDGLKAAHGRIGFGPVLEADTIVDGNDYEPAVIANWNAVGLNLISFGTNFMIVVTNKVAGVAIPGDPGPPATGDYHYARVTSLNVNPYAASQNTRKQTVSRLG